VEADPLEWHQVVSRVAPPSRPLLSGRLSPPEPPVDFTPLKALLVSILKQSVLGTLVVEVITQEPELRYILELLKDYLAEISTDARQRFLVFIIRLFSGSYRDREIIAAMSAELKVLIGSKSKYFFKQPHESQTGAPGGGAVRVLDNLMSTVASSAFGLAKRARWRRAKKKPTKRRTSD
jgi:hypothetical protein